MRIAFALCGAATLAVVGATTEKELKPAVPVLDEMPPMPRGVDGNPIANLTVYVVPHSHDDTVRRLSPTSPCSSTVANLTVFIG